MSTDNNDSIDMLSKMEAKLGIMGCNVKQIENLDVLVVHEEDDTYSLYGIGIEPNLNVNSFIIQDGYMLVTKLFSSVQVYKISGRSIGLIDGPAEDISSLALDLIVRHNQAKYKGIAKTSNTKILGRNNPYGIPYHMGKCKIWR